MVRLLLWCAIACLLCKWASGRWPWELAGWEPGGRSARSAAETKARALLGVTSDANRTEIIEAHKRLVALVHPDRGGSSEQVYEANAARDLLLGRLNAPTE